MARRLGRYIWTHNQPILSLRPFIQLLDWHVNGGVQGAVKRAFAGARIQLVSRTTRENEMTSTIQPIAIRRWRLVAIALITGALTSCAIVPLGHHGRGGHGIRAILAPGAGHGHGAHRGSRGYRGGHRSGHGGSFRDRYRDGYRDGRPGRHRY